MGLIERKVVIRAFRGTVIVRWLVEFGECVAYVTDDTGRGELLAHGRTVRLIGFPLVDVFVATDEDIDGCEIDWSARCLAQP